MRSLSVTFVSSRLRNMMLGAVLALGTMLATGSGGTAQASVAMRALGSPALSLQQDVPPLAENVRWVCGPWRCVWRPNWRYWYVPPYARAWGPPVRPTCYWSRPWGGGWVHVCP
ncbi:hypothetical protein [Ancylobacter moscoviensis]